MEKIWDKHYAACEELYLAVEPAGDVCLRAWTPDQIPRRATAFNELDHDVLVQANDGNSPSQRRCLEVELVVVLSQPKAQNESDGYGNIEHIGLEHRSKVRSLRNLPMVFRNTVCMYFARGIYVAVSVVEQLQPLLSSGQSNFNQKGELTIETERTVIIGTKYPRVL